jgi:hypothetical protein
MKQQISRCGNRRAMVSFEAMQELATQVRTP